MTVLAGHSLRPLEWAIVTSTRTRPDWKALLLLALGLTALYSGALMAGFLNDDHLFLEEARIRTLTEAWNDPRGLANYFRPLSRQVGFALLTPVAGDQPLVFHLANLAVFFVALALLGDLLLAVTAPAAALAGVLWFASLPLQRVNLTWISLRAARTALDEGDTLSARRRPMDAVRAGIGRPQAHAALGELLQDRNRKYALLETQVATRLNPMDWLARRDLVDGLVFARLDGPARIELEALRNIHPNWAADTLAAELELSCANAHRTRVRW